MDGYNPRDVKLDDAKWLGDSDLYYGVFRILSLESFSCIDFVFHVTFLFCLGIWLIPESWFLWRFGVFGAKLILLRILDRIG
jgi:hypothetical protein